tara:strand:- start:1243 stop:1716 length:474 start_codon:yes stop_codon:yes gene_type:complete
MRLEIVSNHTVLASVWRGSLPKPTAKGYPHYFDDMQYWVVFVDDEAVAYTGSIVIDDYAFVGNTYVRKEWRSQGIHKYLLNLRNKSDALKDITKITIINPLIGISIRRLESVVSSLGYTKVESFTDVEDIMHRRVYEDIKTRNVWRLDSDSGENEEE